jgi:hypothetical protein
MSASWRKQTEEEVILAGIADEGLKRMPGYVVHSYPHYMEAEKLGH